MNLNELYMLIKIIFLIKKMEVKNENLKPILDSINESILSKNDKNLYIDKLKTIDTYTIKFEEFLSSLNNTTPETIATIQSIFYSSINLAVKTVIDLKNEGRVILKGDDPVIKKAMEDQGYVVPDNKTPFTEEKIELSNTALWEDSDDE